MILERNRIYPMDCVEVLKELPSESVEFASVSEKCRENSIICIAPTKAFNLAVTAFEKGGAWLDALRDYISENRRLAADFIRENIPNIKAVPSQATYLLWLNCRKVAGCDAKLCRYIREATGLYLSEGSQYGKAGEGFLRMNLACQKSKLQDGLKRLQKGVAGYEAWVSER